MASPAGKKARTIVQVSEDVSNGLEPIPIPVVNETGDGESLPDYFVYTNRYVCRDVHIWNMEVQDLYGSQVRCECEGACRNGSCKCASACMGREFFYDEKDGRLLHDGGTIRECSHLCNCDPKLCQNRRIEKGVRKRLEVFKTFEKGWGARTLEKIKRGEFICEYVGEVLSREFSNLRGTENDEYLLAAVIDSDPRTFDETHVDWPSHLSEIIETPLAPSDAPSARTLFEMDNKELHDQIKKTLGSEVSKEMLAVQINDAFKSCKEKYIKQAADMQEKIDAECHRLAAIHEPKVPKVLFIPKAEDETRVSEKENQIPLDYRSERDELYKDGKKLWGHKKSATALLKLCHQSGGMQGALRKIIQKKNIPDSRVDIFDQDILGAEPDEVNVISGRYSPRKMNLENLDPEEQKKIRYANTVDTDFHGKVLVDAKRYGSVARFLNHSCDPNCTKVGATACQMLSFRVGEKIIHKPFTRMLLFANRDIQPMEELTWDYGYNAKTGRKVRIWCKCGAKNCRKRLLTE